MEDKDKWFYLAVAAVVLTAWLFRWEVTVPEGRASSAGFTHYKLDRLTGTYLACNRGRCTETKIYD